MKQIQLMDTTVRDAQQCLWATRMTTAMMLPIAEKLDNVGFEAVDLAGMIQFDVAVRYLKENPWDRVRLMRKKMPKTPLQGDVRSRSLVGFGVVPDDIVQLWVERCIANGFRRIRIFDALADLDNIVPMLQRVKDLGALAIGALAYGHSPVHTDEFYFRKCKEMLQRVDIDALMLKDAGGLLTPDRVRTLVPGLVKILGKKPLEVHSHCITGLAPIVYLESARLGAHQLQTSIAPLANGPAQPATQSIVRDLRSMGYEVPVDDTLIAEIGEHFRAVAEQEGKPVGVPMAYDAFHYEHQVPGGMRRNFRVQLAEAGMLDKYDQVLIECAQIRKELAWPIMITPFAQLVGVQAVANVVYGERYRVVPNEVKMYAFGHYGKLLGPIDPNVLDKIRENGSPAISEKPEPLPPMIPGLRSRYPGASDDELALRAMFAGRQVDDMLAAGPIKTEYTIDQPLVRFIRDLTKRTKFTHVVVEKGDLKLEIRKTEPAVAASHT